MTRSACAAITTCAVLVMASCSADAVRRGAYEALYRNQCLTTANEADCDRHHQTYDQYRRARDAELHQAR